MATYVNYTGTNGNGFPIQILNFVMVEDFVRINQLFTGMLNHADFNPNADSQCISIWNMDRRYDQPVAGLGNENYTLQIRYGELNDRNSIFAGDNGNSRYITGPQDTCKIKEIFQKLTRFTNYQLKVGTNQADVNRTLDNRIIFVRRSSIRHLFTNLTNDTNIKPAFTTTRGTDANNPNIICNFFRNFADIEDADIPVHDAGGNANLNLRNNYDFGADENIITDANIQGFIEWVNRCRKINIDANNIINRIKTILDTKTSNEPARTILTPFTDGNTVRQNYLGFINKDRGNVIGRRLGWISFRQLIKETYEALWKSTNDPNEKLIIYILTITATNGYNFTGVCTLTQVA